MSLWALAGPLLFAVCGCGQGPAMAPVTGTVSFDGQPVTEGTVSFFPAGGGRPAVGGLGPGGVFELSTFKTGDGALLGDHKVTIEAKKVLNATPPPKSLADEVAQTSPQATPRIEWIVPEKYTAQATSGLTATVIDGDNQIQFNLP